MPWGKARGLDQNGGYVAAINEKTGEELWLVKVYDVTYDGDMEPDKQDVFVTSITLDRASRRLTVENEAGERYAVDLAASQKKLLAPSMIVRLRLLACAVALLAVAATAMPGDAAVRKTGSPGAGRCRLV